MPNDFYKKILVVNPFGIGDAIFSMYLVEAIKKEWPEAVIGFLGNERTGVLLGMNRSIDVGHEFNRDEFRSLRQSHFGGFLLKIVELCQKIKKENYDTMFDLSLGREFSFVAACLGIRRRVGFNFNKRGRWLTHRVKLLAYEKKHVVDWQFDLLRLLHVEPARISSKLPLFVSGQAKKNAEEFLIQNGVKNEAGLIAVAPGGGKSWGPNAVYKQWASSGFAEVIHRYAEGKPATVLILGDSEERPLLEQLKKALSTPTVVVAGQNLDVVSALLGRSQFLLCNDGGLLHLANALGVKTVSVYGPVDEKVYGPYGADSSHEMLTQDVPCRPCYQKFHFPPCEHQRRCLEQLSVEKVLAAVKKIS